MARTATTIAEMRWSEEWFAKHKGLKSIARGNHRPQPKVNKTEERYAQQLELRKHAGEIVQWWREPCRWRMGSDKKCTYTPDFLVLYPDGTEEYVEVKGFLRDDASVKFKVAARIYPQKKWTMVREAPPRSGQFEVIKSY